MADKTLTLDTSLAFDQTKQAAIVGWCLRDDLFCVQCVMVLKAEWFSSPLVAKIFAAILDTYNNYHRRPTPQEMHEYRPFMQEDATVQKRIPEVIKDCGKQSGVYGLDMLRAEMTHWIRCVIFEQSVNKAVETFNQKKPDEAWQIIDHATLLKATASFEEGISQGFLPAKDRIKQERAQRLEQKDRILGYGVKFLDDSLIGIPPNDLVVIGAKTGAGKTQLATSIALYNSVKGLPVHYFALEAEENEIERRIKFGLLATRYFKTMPQDAPYLGYSEWRMGAVDKIVYKMEDAMEDEYQQAVGNLHTLYRTSGNFGLRDLERELMRVVTKSRLIIIDHLHYIDTGEDENHAYKQTIKMIRDIVLRYSVPVIVIAHLRKAASGKNQATTLTPLIEEFHGTSDIPKISTTCIMLAPDYDPAHRINGQKYLLGTMMSTVKSRLDGSKARFVGLTHFNQRTLAYEDPYALSYQGYEWDVLAGFDVPYWAKDSVRPDFVK